MVIEGSGLVGLLVWVIVIGCIFGLLWWLIGYIGLPEPFDKVARVIVALVAVIVLLDLVFGLGIGANNLRLRL